MSNRKNEGTEGGAMTLLDDGAAPVRIEKLLIAGLRGFCAGVVRAIDVVEQALEVCDGTVYVRKEIIHNRYVVEELRSRGAVFVEEVDEVPDGSWLIFSAHGVAPAVREAARRKRLRTIDATCPLVTKVHLEVLRFARKGYTIIFIGHRDHDETIGTLGEAPDSVRVVGSRAEAETIEIRDAERIVYLTQTTLSVDETREIVEVLKRRFPALEVPPKDDICYATQNRQDAIKALGAHVDVLLVLGAPNSSNSLRLCEVSRARNVPAYLIETAADIRTEWLAGARTVGLTASASAPEILVQEVVEFARMRLGAESIEELHAVREDVHFIAPHELSALVDERKRTAG
jgi:4-hydroxy-3-methylbut-2-enyl diphosphate reductase